MSVNVCMLCFSVCECVCAVMLMGLSVTVTWSNEEIPEFHYARKHTPVFFKMRKSLCTYFLMKDFFKRSQEV